MKMILIVVIAASLSGCAAYTDALFASLSDPYLNDGYHHHWHDGGEHHHGEHHHNHEGKTR